jgi:hypothetical protein
VRRPVLRIGLTGDLDGFSKNSLIVSGLFAFALYSTAKICLPFIVTEKSKCQPLDPVGENQLWRRIGLRVSTRAGSLFIMRCQRDAAYERLCCSVLLDCEDNEGLQSIAPDSESQGHDPHGMPYPAGTLTRRNGQ